MKFPLRKLRLYKEVAVGFKLAIFTHHKETITIHESIRVGGVFQIPNHSIFSERFRTNLQQQNCPPKLLKENLRNESTKKMRSLQISQKKMS